jgi:hypothetical protein
MNLESEDICVCNTTRHNHYYNGLNKMNHIFTLKYKATLNDICDCNSTRANHITGKYMFKHIFTDKRISNEVCKICTTSRDNHKNMLHDFS